MKRYVRLEAWQAAHQLVLLTYRATKAFPREELYGLTSQARRAAFSVAANIAEARERAGRLTWGLYRSGRNRAGGGWGWWAGGAEGRTATPPHPPTPPFF